MKPIVSLTIAPKKKNAGKMEISIKLVSTWMDIICSRKKSALACSKVSRTEVSITSSALVTANIKMAPAAT